MVYNIYTLSCPIDGVVKYVGLTRNSDFTQRLSQHNSNSGRTYDMAVWLIKLKSKRLEPKMELLDTIETTISK